MKRHHIKAILENPLDRLWTVQGFGKMSTNITADARIHVWDRVLLNPRVPAVHSHSYDFKSVVFAGRVRNLRFREFESGEPWNRVLVASTGEGLIEEPRTTFLHEGVAEVYGEGHEYKQTADEVHWSVPDDGSVTLVQWIFGPNPQYMKVYWRGRVPYADAKPRKATEDEILSVTQNALDTWF